MGNDMGIDAVKRVATGQEVKATRTNFNKADKGPLIFELPDLLCGKGKKTVPVVPYAPNQNAFGG